MKKNLPPDTLHVPGYGPVKVRDLIRLEASGNYTVVYVEGHRRAHLCATPLIRFGEKLSRFVRIHESHLINPLHVDKMERDGQDGDLIRITMRDGVILTVARRRVLESVRAVVGVNTDSINAE